MVSDRYLIIFCLIGLSYGAIDLEIPSDGRPHFLYPLRGPTMTITQWNLKACLGCKMLLSCMFHVTSCSAAKIRVDNGEKTYLLCPSDGIQFSNISMHHLMSVAIQNAGPNKNSFCQVEATKPFLMLSESLKVQVNSKEYGNERKSMRRPTCRCGWSNKSPQRIVGGQTAGLHEFPFVVRLKISGRGITFCGGSIITEKVILTAAHCTYPYLHRNLSVLVGEHDLRSKTETDATREIEARKLIVHPQFDSETLMFDISLMILKQKIEFTDLVGPVCLPAVQRNYVGDYIKVMGWGLTRDETEGGRTSNVLRKVNVRVIDPDVCGVLYQAETKTQICTHATNKDSCGGDSGGPLVRVNPMTNMYQQVALVSYGKKCGSTDPAVNTDVARFMDWIRENVREYSGGQICY